MKNITMNLALSTFLLMTSAAWASWGTFISTGPATGIGNPSWAFVPSGHAVCAVRSGKSVIMVNEFNGTSWGTWKSLSGTVASNPSCTSSSGGLAYSIYNGTSWSAFKTVSTSAVSAPGCATDNAGGVVCAVVTVGGATLRPAT